jgi:hypothetical protein
MLPLYESTLELLYANEQDHAVGPKVDNDGTITVANGPQNVIGT